MDSFRFVITNSDSKKVRFVSWSRILDLYRIVDHESSHFQKIRFADLFRDAIFKRFDESNKSYKSSRILSTMAQNESLRIHAGGFANPDSQIRTLKIRFVDSFRRLHHKLPVSWFGFVEIFFKYPFRGFDS